MAKVRRLEGLGTRYMLANAGLLALCLVCFGTLFYRASLWWRGGGDPWFYLAAAGLIAGVAGCLVLDRVMIRRVRCPDCGRMLDRTKPPFGKLISIQYECDACDTIWDTEKQVPNEINPPL